MDLSANRGVAAGTIERHPGSESLSEEATGRCIPTRKFRSMQWRRHSDFRTSVESIGPAPAQFIYCAVTDKTTEQIASTNWLF